MNPHYARCHYHLTSARQALYFAAAAAAEAPGSNTDLVNTLHDAMDRIEQLQRTVCARDRRRAAAPIAANHALIERSHE